MITPRGRETFQVLLVVEEGRWVARIVTLPNRMWIEPGGRTALKFFGASRDEAESAAASFIESARISQGMRAAGPAEASASIAPRITLAPRPAFQGVEKEAPSRRFLQRLLLRFGGQRPELPGVTANLSETGLFIITSQPRPVGAAVEIDLRFAQIPVFLGGEVVWISPERREGVSVGFGVRLLRRPGDYLEHLRALCLPHSSVS